MTLVNMLEKRLVNLLEKRLVICSMRLQIRDLTEDLAGDVLEVMVVVIPADQSDVLISEDQSHVLEVTVVLISADVLVTTHVILS